MIRNHRNKFESGYCTGKFCRTFLENGQGQQVQNQDGTIDRFCPRHWHEYIHNLEIAAAELRREGEKGYEALTAGGALLAIILLCFRVVLG